MTRTASDIDVAGIRSSERIRTASIRPMVVIGWAGAVALVVAGGTLAAVTFAHSEEGKAEAPTGRADTGTPVCVWVSQVDGPVVPAELLAAAPTPESVLVFEECDGDWTGDIAWLDPGGDLMPSSGDDGLPNPFEAGNRAVERLDE